MNNISKAKRFCAIAHGSQKRKYTDMPYWVHPFAVAELVSMVTDNEDIIIAAYLHDTLEDTSVIYDDLVEFFGHTVAQLVYEVSDVSRPEDGNRKVRKDLDRQHLAKASPEGQTIKLADLIDNSHSITRYDPNFAIVYMKEKARLLEVLTKGDKTLLEKAKKIVEDHEQRRKK